MLESELGSEEQKLFLENFKSFLHNDPEKDYVIDLEFAFKWLGLSRKDVGKRIIEKHFMIESDYILLHQNAEQDCSWGGNNKEKILLTPNTFKELCILANTPKGHQVRRYYIKMEAVMNKYIKLQHDITMKQLQEATQKAANMEFALEAEKEKVDRILKRAVHKEAPGQLVYIYRESDNKHRIGESRDVKRRESEHRASNTGNMIVYTKRCCNSRLLEKVVHHILDQYRDIKNREWFSVTFDVAKTTLDAAHAFLDGLVDRCDTIHDNTFFDKLRNLIESLPEKEKEHKPIEQETADKQVESVDDSIKVGDIIPYEKPIVNPLDFDKFIDECCERDDEYTTFSVEVFGAHRQWSRCTQKSVHNAFFKYLCTNFKRVRVFDEKTKAKLISYKGIRVKPITYIKPNPLEDIDLFIEEMCELNYVARISTKEIYNAFEKWKNDRNYVMCPKEKQRINNGFRERFVPSLVYTGKQGEHGFFFVTLKTGIDNTVGFKLAEKLKKRVAKIDILTNQVVETFESLTAASKAINRVASTLCEDIKFKKPRDNFLYKYI